jgi:acyl dehydratase
MTAARVDPRSDLPVDPTAYRPASVVAGRDVEVGTTLDPIRKKVTLDKCRIYQGWPRTRNRHTDYAAAQATGLREPNVSGGQVAESVGEMFIKFFGEGFVGGSLSVTFLGYVNIDDEVSVHGTVVGRDLTDDGRVRLTIRMTAQTQDGRTVLAASATGYARD